MQDALWAGSQQQHHYHHHQQQQQQQSWQQAATEVVGDSSPSAGGASVHGRNSCRAEVEAEQRALQDSAANEIVIIG